MPIKFVTDMGHLFRLAKKAGETNDPEDIRRHKEYESLCLSSDEIVCQIPKD